MNATSAPFPLLLLPSRAAAHFACIRACLVGVLLGVAITAFGADASSSSGDSALPGWLLTLLHEGGLPAVLGWASWTLRGKLQNGIQLTVSLSETDRRLLRRLGDKPEGSHAAT